MLSYIMFKITKMNTFKYLKTDLHIIKYSNDSSIPKEYNH